MSTPVTDACALLRLPERDNAHALEIERLTIERDTARAERDATRAELNRVRAAAWLLLSNINGAIGILDMRKPLEVVRP